MRITLEFDGYEERTEALQAQHAVDYLVALEEVKDELRRRWKYVEYETQEAREAIDDLYGWVCDLIGDLPGGEL